MTFADSIRICFTKYADFGGRASRSEYWWFFLFLLVVGALLGSADDNAPLYALFSLAVLLPSLSAAARRLHDCGRSGWWLLLWLLPLLGFIVLLVMLAQPGEAGSNDFGPQPADAPAAA
jgi:uncharacterized membrane protein YhaH (DUF805 family)